MTVKTNQGDGVSCGVLSTLVNGLIDPDKPLRQQKDGIAQKVEHAIANKKDTRNAQIAVVAKIDQLKQDTKITLDEYKAENFLTQPWNDYIDYSKWQEIDYRQVSNKLSFSLLNSEYALKAMPSSLQKEDKQTRYNRYHYDLSFTNSMYNCQDYVEFGKEKYQQNLHTLEQCRREEWRNHLPIINDHHMQTKSAPVATKKTEEVNSSNKAPQKPQQVSSPVKVADKSVASNYNVSSPLKTAAATNPLCALLATLMSFETDAKQTKGDKDKIRNNFIQLISLINQYKADGSQKIGEKIILNENFVFLGTTEQTGESCHNSYTINDGCLQKQYVGEVARFLENNCVSDDNIVKYFDEFKDIINQNNGEEPLIKEIKQIISHRNNINNFSSYAEKNVVSPFFSKVSNEKQTKQLVPNTTVNKRYSPQ